MRHAWVLLGFSLLVRSTAAWAEPRPAEEVTFAEGGLARLEIVFAPRAAERTREVAAELAHHLGRITGAAFAVSNGDGSRGIVLGTIDQFPGPVPTEGLTIRGAYDGKEAYAIRTGAASPDTPPNAAPPVLAFPGAEGFGAVATGGRGGTVL